MATITTSEPRLVLEKAAIVYARDFGDVGCVCRIRISYESNTNQGSISIRFSTALAGSRRDLRLMVVQTGESRKFLSFDDPVTESPVLAS